MTELETEEKRLLDSFKLHEVEAGRISSEGQVLEESEVIGNQLVGKYRQGEEIAQSKVLEKEEEVLGGTFGDPAKLKDARGDNIKGHQEEAEDNSDEHEHNLQMKTEPGPAFMNSMMQDQTPRGKDNEKDNPFHWEDPSKKNLSKLVRLTKKEPN